MKKLMAMAILATIATGGAAYADSNQDAMLAKNGSAVKVCGKLQVTSRVDDNGKAYESKSLVVPDHKATWLLADQTWALALNSSFQPQGLDRALIQYQRVVLSILKEGNTYCAIGIKTDNKISSNNLALFHFAIIEEKGMQ